MSIRKRSRPPISRFTFRIGHVVFFSELRCINSHSTTSLYHHDVGWSQILPDKDFQPLKTNSKATVFLEFTRNDGVLFDPDSTSQHGARYKLVVEVGPAGINWLWSVGIEVVLERTVFSVDCPII